MCFAAGECHEHAAAAELSPEQHCADRGVLYTAVVRTAAHAFLAVLCNLQLSCAYVFVCTSSIVHALHR